MTNLNDFTQTVAQQLKNLSSFVLLLHGEMGAGKTHFVREFCGEVLGLENVSSPTFSIINQYADDVYHLDLYRVENTAELNHLNLGEIFGGENKVFVEWAERLPKEFIANFNNVFCVRIEKNGEKKRKYTWH